MTIAAKQERGESAGSPLPEMCAILLDGLQALADAGEADRACRLAGRACAALRDADDDRLWRRFNALLHRIAPRTGPVGMTGTAGSSTRALS